MVTRSAIVALLAVLVAGASASTSASSGEVVEACSESAIALATEYLVSRLGDEIYSRDFSPLDCEPINGPKGRGTRSAVGFRFAPPTRPWVDVTVEVVVNHDGRCSGRGQWSIPDCVNRPELCEIEISPEEAVEISEGEGVSDDYLERSVTLRATGEYDGFVWLIRYIQPAKNLQRSSREIVVDARTGEVLSDQRYLTVY
jgi:hypothetical protein